MKARNVLVTGGAGFIGSNLVDALLASPDDHIYCIDNFNAAYDPAIKRKNLSAALTNPRFHLTETDLSHVTGEELAVLFKSIPIDCIIHLAARAGVRPSLQQPAVYYDANVKGTLHLLEFARIQKVPRFLFASSSSVYGNNPELPWQEDKEQPQPISPYGATKLAGEELGKVYAALYGIQFIILRFFTVYGPRQRPDLAIHKFYELIKEKKPIPVYGDGSTGRDYTYVTDTVAGIMAALNYKGRENLLVNLGDNKQISLLQLIRSLEKAMQETAIIEWMPEQPGDVRQTYADISKAASLLGYQPKIMIEEGLQLFVSWKKNQNK